MVDITVALVLCVTAAVMAYMGVHVTLHPPREKNKNYWKASFWAVALLASVGVIVQAVRNNQTQDSLRKQLTDIQANTAKPTPSADLHDVRWDAAYNVAVNGINTGSHVPFTIGKPVVYNIGISNKGIAAAKGFWVYAKVYNAADDSEQTEAAMTNQFKNEIASHSQDIAQSTIRIEPGTGTFSTTHTDYIISKADKAKFDAGKEVVYLYYYLTWRDPSGVHRDKQCLVTQTPAFNPEVWHYCHDFSSRE